MGGALILSPSRSSTLLWADLRNRYVWLVLARDARLRPDRLLRRLPEARRRATRAASPRAGSTSGSRSRGSPRRSRSSTRREARRRPRCYVPFFKNVVLPLSAVGFVVLAYFVIVGSQQRGEPDRRARRPRDHAQRDGRRRRSASSPTSPGNVDLRRLPADPLRAGRRRAADLLRGDRRRRASASSGSTPIPAQVFMGDIGSLALGAALGIVAVIVRQELVLVDHGRRVRGRDPVGDHAGRVVQAAPASASSAWRRSTTTSSSRAGRSRR